MRPKDSNQLAKQIVDISTGQIPDPMPPHLTPKRASLAKPRRTAHPAAKPRKPRSGWTHSTE